MPEVRATARVNLTDELRRVDGIPIGLDAGATVPTDADTGWAESCLFIHTDAVTAGVDNVLINVGTKASANFDKIQFVNDNTDDATGILVSGGSTVPADATSGFAVGALFIDTAGATSVTRWYVNTGTAASCNFDAVTAA